MSADRITRLNTALEGRYRIESELGEGGMATVFLATDLKHERRVAIKVLKEELATVVGPERFLAEIKTTANLQHPAILPLHDSGVADGHVFYAMPHVLGATLRDRIAQEGPLPLDEVARITGEIASGLAYAHAQGVIHRDVKPGNILLSDGHAVLADFGLAKAVLPEGAEALTEAGGVGGTIRYMSPEQVRGDATLDARADQYSLACVVYEMLTGEPLFTGRTSWAVIARQMSRELESPSIVRPEVPVATDEVIQKALELSPSDRFTDTVEFARALADSLSPRPADRGGVRSTGSWRIPLAIGSAIVLAAAAAVNWLMPGPELDAQRVIVFPLMDQRADRTDQAIGEQVAIMVGTALEHAEPLRWVDGWDWLAVSERTDMGSWSIQRGTTIAHEQGAKFVIDGRIMDEGDSASVLLRLHDARSGALVQTSLLAGPTGELPSLGRRALVALLPNLIDPGRVVEADAFDEFAPEVVAAWLNGEREYRESRFESAFESFTRAVEGDSAMALAAIRGAQAARWLFENGTASTLIDVALANEASLSSRNRDLARGIRSYFDGDAAESERLLRGITTEYPDWSDAWMALGEVYYHLMPAIGSGGDRAEDAFRRALLNDPGFTPPLVHLAEISFRKGDAALGDSLNSAFQESNEGSVFATELDLMSMCVKSGPAAPQWAQVAGTQVGGEAVTYAAVNLGVGGAYPECATEGFQALATWGPELEGGGARGGAVAVAWSTLVGLQSVQGARGRPEQVRDLISGADQFDRPRDYLWAMAALSGLPFEQEARDAVERLQIPAEWSTTALWSIGAWHALNGDPEVVEETVRIARARSAAALPDSVSVFALLGDALDAWSSLARADTSVAIERFAALTPVSPPSGLQWSLWEPLAAERFTLARLRMTTGDFEGAIQAASVFDHPQPVIYVAFLGESLRLRVEAAEALGERALAKTYRARLDRLR